MAQKIKGYLVTYLYVAPDGTFLENEKRPIESHSGIFNTINKAIKFIGNLFDGKETYYSTIVPEILCHEFNKGEAYNLEDSSAGQWATITPIFEINDTSHKIEVNI